MGPCRIPVLENCDVPLQLIGQLPNGFELKGQLKKQFQCECLRSGSAQTTVCLTTDMDSNVELIMEIRLKRCRLQSVKEKSAEKEAQLRNGISYIAAVAESVLDPVSSVCFSLSPQVGMVNQQDLPVSSATRFRQEESSTPSSSTESYPSSESPTLTPTSPSKSLQKRIREKPPSMRTGETDRKKAQIFPVPTDAEKPFPPFLKKPTKPMSAVVSFSNSDEGGPSSSSPDVEGKFADVKLLSRKPSVKKKSQSSMVSKKALKRRPSEKLSESLSSSEEESSTESITSESSPTEKPKVPEFKPEDTSAPRPQRSILNPPGLIAKAFVKSEQLPVTKKPVPSTSSVGFIISEEGRESSITEKALEAATQQLKKAPTLVRTKSEKGIGKLQIRKNLLGPPPLPKKSAEIKEEEMAADAKSRLVYYLNRIALHIGGNDIREVFASAGFKMLLELTHSMNMEKMLGHEPKLFVSMEEIESELFWDSALTEFSKQRWEDVSSSPKSKQPGDSVFPIGENRYGRIPSTIGRRNRLTVWSNVYSRLIDRAVLCSIMLELNKPRLKEQSRKMEGQTGSPTIADLAEESLSVTLILKHLLFLHQSTLWSARVLRLVSLFNQSASSFAKDVIEQQLFGTRLSQKGVSRHRDTLCPLSPLHPLSAFRFFEHDKVFVQSSGQTEVGGGLMGILVLGSDSVDIETACKTYGREALAQRWISGKLIKIKAKFLRQRIQREIKKGGLGLGKSSGLFSIKDWIINPPTLLSPSLLTSIDYLGFRVVVFPLYYRPPVKVDLDSLRVGNRIAAEFTELSVLTGLTVFKKPSMCLDRLSSSSSQFDLLQLEQEHPPLCILHRVHSILPNEVFKSSEEQSYVNSFRPELIRSLTLSQRLQQQLVISNPNSPNIYEQHDSNSIGTSCIDNFQLFDSYSTIAFSQASKGLNQFKPPQIPLSELHFYETPIVDKLRLATYLRSQTIPRMLRILENQPFFTPCDSISFTSWIHSIGMNCSTLGQLLNTTRHTWVRELIMSEIVGRTLKHILYNCIRVTLFLEIPFNFDQDSNPTLIAKHLPLPSAVANSLFDSGVMFASRSWTSEIKKVDAKQHYTIADVMAMNLLRITFGTSPVCDLFWREVLAVQSSLRFQCNPFLIRQSECRATAVLLSFEHHTGIQLNVDATSFAARLDASASTLRPRSGSKSVGLPQTFVQPLPSLETSDENESPHSSTLPLILSLDDCLYWKCRAKLCLSIEELKESLMIFEIIEDPTLIRFLPVEFTQEGDSKTRSSLKSESPSVERTSKESPESLVKDSYPNQRYLSKQICIILQAALSFHFQQQRETAVDIIESKHIETIQGDFQYISLLNSLRTAPPPTIYSSPRRSTIQLNNWELHMAILELSLWGMSEALWEFAQFIALESLGLFPDESLSSIFARWVVVWCNTHRGRKTNLPPRNQLSIRSLIATCFDLISSHWDNHHPLTSHTLLAVAWSEYVNSNLPRVQFYIKMAIQHSLDIATNRNVALFVDLTYLPTFPRSIFDPASRPLIDAIPTPAAESHLGHLFHVLGGACLAQAARNYLKVDFKDEERRTELELRLEEQTKFLCDEAIESFRIAIRIFETCFAARMQVLLLASAKFDLSAALFIKTFLASSNQIDYGGVAIRECLELSMEAYTTRSKLLESHHPQLLLSVTQLARLLQRQKRNDEALKFWEEALEGAAKLSDSLRMAQTDVFQSTSIIRHENIFSLLLFSLPSAHFAGIYEAEAPPGRSFLKITRRFLFHANPLLLDLSHIKLNIITLYLNTSLSKSLLSDLIKLFQTVNEISFELSHSAVQLSKVEAFERSKTSSDVLQFDRPTSATDIDFVLEFIESFPRLFSRKQLLDPDIKTCLPIPNDRQLTKGTSIDTLMKQLVRWSHEDLLVFRQRVVLPTHRKDLPWDNCRDSVRDQKESSFEGLSAEVPKYSPLEYFLAIRSPLEAYSFTSEAFNILVSVLSEFWLHIKELDTNRL